MHTTNSSDPARATHVLPVELYFGSWLYVVQRRLSARRSTNKQDSMLAMRGKSIGSRQDICGFPAKGHVLPLPRILAVARCEDDWDRVGRVVVYS